MADVAKTSKFANIKKNLVRFVKDVRSELKKVIWPNREQLTNNTVTVLLSCLVIGGLIWIVDAILGQAVKFIFTK